MDRNRIADDWRLWRRTASDALRRRTPALHLCRRAERRHDGAGVARHQGRRTGRRQVLLGETHQDWIPRLNTLYLLRKKNSFPALSLSLIANKNSFSLLNVLSILFGSHNTRIHAFSSTYNNNNNIETGESG